MPTVSPCEENPSVVVSKPEISLPERVTNAVVSALPLFSTAVMTVILCVQLLQVVIARTLPLRYWVEYITDDAYYYLGVAWNLAHAHVSQFRAPLETNGYQPLWLMLLTVLQFILRGDKALLAQAAILLSGVCALLAYAPSRYSALPRSIAVVLAITCFPSVFLAGMETALILPLVLLLIRSRERNRQFSCLWFAALFYARLDALAIFVVFQAYDYFFEKQRISVLLKRTLWVVLLITPYFVCNYIHFGIAVPVSGLAKSLGNIPGENLAILTGYLRDARFPVVVVLLTAFIHWISPRKEYNPAQRLACLFLVVDLICAAYYTVFSGWPLWEWYSWPIALATVFSLSGLFDAIQLRMNSGMPFNRALALMIILLLTVTYSTRRMVKTYVFGSLAKTVKLENTSNSFGEENVENIEHLLSNRPAETLAMGDRAGSLGFWMPERDRFIHLEGLVASKPYYEAMKNGTAVNFLEQNGVSLLVVDRERYFVSNLAGTTVYGVAEPIQGLSAHRGPYLMCFPAQSILYMHQYGSATRYIFQFDQMVPCPADIRTQFESLLGVYRGIRSFTFPTEVSREAAFGKSVRFTW